MAQTKTATEQAQQRGSRDATAGAQTGARDITSERRSANGEAGAEGNDRPRTAVKGWNEAQLARGLGWFSLGLGLAGLLAPQGLARLIGVRGQHTGLFRLLGARELASGIGILTQRKPNAGVWSRVGGDAIDLALLGTALASPKAQRGRLATTAAAVAGVTALDLFCSQQLSLRANAHTPGSAMRVTQAITINRSPEELYQFWRNFQNLPRFMKHLQAVQLHDATAGASAAATLGQAADAQRSHWVARGPAGTTVEWDAEIIEDQPNELIAWRSLEGADVDNTGSVRFERAPGGRGTVVRVKMQYAPPAGVLGATVAKLFGQDPAWQIKDDLRRFKQVMETGEIITTVGQPAGRSSSTSWRYDRAVRS